MAHPEPRPSPRPSLGVALLVVSIFVGTALALWFYLSEPTPRAERDVPAVESEAVLDGATLSRGAGPALARSGG